MYVFKDAAVMLHFYWENNILI